jgi:hypothetical protein
MDDPRLESDGNEVHGPDALDLARRSVDEALNRNPHDERSLALRAFLTGLEQSSTRVARSETAGTRSQSGGPERDLTAPGSGNRSRAGTRLARRAWSRVADWVTRWNLRHVWNRLLWIARVGVTMAIPLGLALGGWVVVRNRVAIVQQTRHLAESAKASLTRPSPGEVRSQSESRSGTRGGRAARPEATQGAPASRSGGPRTTSRALAEPRVPASSARDPRALAWTMPRWGIGLTELIRSFPPGAVQVLHEAEPPGSALVRGARVDVVRFASGTYSATYLFDASGALGAVQLRPVPLHRRLEPALDDLSRWLTQRDGPPAEEDSGAAEWTLRRLTWATPDGPVTLEVTRDDPRRAHVLVVDLSSGSVGPVVNGALLTFSRPGSP